MYLSKLIHLIFSYPRSTIIVLRYFGDDPRWVSYQHVIRTNQLLFRQKKIDLIEIHSKFTLLDLLKVYQA